MATVDQEIAQIIGLREAGGDWKKRLSQISPEAQRRLSDSQNQGESKLTTAARQSYSQTGEKQSQVLSEREGSVSSREQAVAQEEKTKTSRQARLKSGVEFGKEFIGDESLGRIGEDLGRADTQLGRIEGKFDESRSSDVQQIIDERRKALGGLDDEQTRILRSRAEQQIGRTEETQRRRTAAIQNVAGVRGATAASQQLMALQQGAAQRTEFERDLILANKSAQQQALGAFEQSVNFAESAESQRKSLNINIEQGNLAQQLQERNLQQFNLSQELQEKQLEQFNLAQAAREKFGQIGIGFGIEGMKLSEEASKRASEAAVASGAAASGGGGGVTVICTELHRQGIMSDELFEKEKVVGAELRKNDPKVYKGYYIWAKHVAKAMSKSKLLTSLIKAPALAWANQLAGKPSLLGLAIVKIGTPLCRFIGGFCA